MPQSVRKPAPWRTWVLSLGLLAGLGLFVTACGDEKTPTPAPTPAPTPTPPTPTPTPLPPPPPPAPDALRVPTDLKAESGAGWIEWSWTGVEGARAYHIQVSFNDQDFTVADSFSFVTQTTYRLSFREKTTAYARLRTAGGTTAAPEYSDWTDTVGTESGLPPATALATPGSLDASNPGQTTVDLTWDEVSNAATYDVQQRVEDATSWSAATCATGAGTTEETSCQATGLTAETSYEFRVRALPASGDTGRAASSWSSVVNATTADDTTPAVIVGAGDLNLIWSSDEKEKITFIWDRIAGAEFEVAIADSADDCANADYVEPKSGKLSTSEVVDGTGNGKWGAQGLCVRTTDREHMSFANGVPRPSNVPKLASDNGTIDVDGVTTAITWEIASVQLVGNFDYEFRVVADPIRANNVNTDPKAQDACLAGDLLKGGDTDIDVTFDQITLDDLEIYTGYLLCARMLNSAGATNWVVPDKLAKVETLPGRPSAPQIAISLTTVDDANAIPVWTVATREDEDVPRTKVSYVAKSIKYPEFYDGGSDGKKDDRVPTPSTTICESGKAGSHLQWAVKTVNDISNDPDGIVIELGSQVRPKNADVDDIVHICVQAKLSDDRSGPWVLGSAYTIEKKAAAAQ